MSTNANTNANVSNNTCKTATKVGTTNLFQMCFLGLRKDFGFGIRICIRFGIGTTFVKRRQQHKLLHVERFAQSWGLSLRNSPFDILEQVGIHLWDEVVGDVEQSLRDQKAWTVY